MACDDIRNLIDTSPCDGAAVRCRDQFAVRPVKQRGRSRRRLPQQRPRQNTPATHVQQGRQFAITQLADADRRRLFKHINHACRDVAGRCWRGGTITPAQRERIQERAAQLIQADGIRISPERLQYRVSFWLGVYDPARGIWFDVYDVAKLSQIIASRLPGAELTRLNEQFRDQLDGRNLDYLTLAFVGVAVAKNSLVRNHKTRLEECGTSALIGLLASVGISANGTLIRLCRDVLVELDLIRCTDRRYYSKGAIGPGMCQKWVPCGAMWGLSFLSEVRPEQLSEAQRAEFDRFHASREQQAAPHGGDYYGILSVGIQPIYHTYPISTYPTQSYHHSTSVIVSDNSPDPDSDEILVTDYGTTAPTGYPQPEYSYNPFTPCDHEQDDSAPAPASLVIDAAPNDWDGSAWEEV